MRARAFRLVVVAGLVFLGAGAGRASDLAADRGLGDIRLVSYDSTATLDEIASGSGGDDCDCDCDCGYGSIWENTSIFAAADGWRTRADDDYPGNFGFRTGFNSGIGWWDSPVRVQIGGSYGAYDLSGRDGDFGADPLHPASSEQQLFFTGGVYKRSDVANGELLSWGGVIDVIYDNHFGEQAQEILLTQVRGSVGYALSECNEVGVWGASRANWQRLITPPTQTFPRGRFRVRGLGQLNAFWHHNWAFGGDTWLYAGFGEQPVATIIGLTGQAPLSPSVALFGGVAYGIPSAPAGDLDGGNGQNYSEEYWNISFGIVWYPGCKATNDTVSGHRGLPLLPVADNGSFFVKARPGNL